MFVILVVLVLYIGIIITITIVTIIIVIITIIIIIKVLLCYRVFLQDRGSGECTFRTPLSTFSVFDTCIDWQWLYHCPECLPGSNPKKTNIYT